MIATLILSALCFVLAVGFTAFALEQIGVGMKELGDFLFGGVMVMAAVVFLLFCLSACGSMDSTHTFQGDATVHIVVGVDVSPCYHLPEAEQAECIRAMIDLADVAASQNETLGGSL